MRAGISDVIMIVPPEYGPYFLAALGLKVCFRAGNSRHTDEALELANTSDPALDSGPVGQLKVALARKGRIGKHARSAMVACWSTNHS